MTDHTPGKGLRRDIGLWGSTALVLNGLVGAGIFAAPATLAAAAGPWGPAMFLAVGLLFVSIVLAFAELARRVSATGGPVVYAHEAFGGVVGFETGWFLYLGRVTALAANTNILLDYAAIMTPALDSTWPRLGVTAVLFSALVAANLRGVREGVWLLLALTVLKLAPLLALALTGISTIAPGSLLPEGTAPIANPGEIVLLLVYTFTGFEGALVPAGETRRPDRTIPLALISIFLAVTGFFTLLQLVYQSNLPAVQQPSPRPLADLAIVLWGTAGGLVIALTAIFSVTGNLASIVLAAPRMTLALAQQGSLPTWFAKLDPRTGVPRNSIIFVGLAGYLLAASGSFAWLAGMSSLARIVAYLTCILALPNIRRRQGERPIKWSDVAIAPGILLCVWVAFNSEPGRWTLMVIFAIIGAVLYAVARRAANTKRSHPTP